MASTDARPVPIKNTAYRAVFPILDADGDLVTGAAGLDSESSQDQGAFADCASEAVEIAASSGVYYLDLSASEMNADCVAVIVKTSTSGAKTTVLVFYPQEAGDIKVDLETIKTQAVTCSGGVTVPAATLASTDNVLDLADGVETGLTVRQALKVIAAALGGLVSGAGTSAVTIRACNNDGTTRITATVDSSGDRSAITLNV